MRVGCGTSDLDIQALITCSISTRLKQYETFQIYSNQIKEYVVHVNMESKPELATRSRNFLHQSLWRSSMLIYVDQLELWHSKEKGTLLYLLMTILE